MAQRHRPASVSLAERQALAPGLVVVGVSQGGLEAVGILLGGLAPRFPWAVVVVQHREKGSSDRLAALLGAKSALPVSDAEDKQPRLPGCVFLAPADYHLLVERDHLALSVDDVVHFARPSIDVLSWVRCRGLCPEGGRRDPHRCQRRRRRGPGGDCAQWWHGRGARP